MNTRSTLETPVWEKPAKRGFIDFRGKRKLQQKTLEKFLQQRKPALNQQYGPDKMRQYGPARYSLYGLLLLRKSACMASDFRPSAADEVRPDLALFLLLYGL
jgi:hypothetical protein